MSIQDHSAEVRLMGKCSDQINEVNEIIKNIFKEIDKQILKLHKNIIDKTLNVKWEYKIFYNVFTDKRKRDGIDFITYTCRGVLARRTSTIHEVLCSAVSAEFKYLDLAYLDFIHKLYSTCKFLNKRYDLFLTTMSDVNASIRLVRDVV
jgi:hypothetical protein